MKQKMAGALLVVLVGAQAAQARVNVEANGAAPPLPPPALGSSYPPAAPAPGAPPPLVVDQAPQFIYLPALGLYMSVEIPYDIAYVEGGYYLYSAGYWYSSRSYRGPWALVPARRLPVALRRHRYVDIRDFRNREYQEFQQDRAHYRGSWYRPGLQHREERRRERREGRH